MNVSMKSGLEDRNNQTGRGQPRHNPLGSQ